MELLAHATQARLRPQRVLATVGRTAADARAFKGRRASADDTVPWILSLLEA